MVSGKFAGVLFEKGNGRTMNSQVGPVPPGQHLGRQTTFLLVPALGLDVQDVGADDPGDLQIRFSRRLFRIGHDAEGPAGIERQVVA